MNVPPTLICNIISSIQNLEYIKRILTFYYIFFLNTLHQISVPVPIFLPDT